MVLGFSVPFSSSLMLPIKSVYQIDNHLAGTICFEGIKDFLQSLPQGSIQSHYTLTVEILHLSALGIDLERKELDGCKNFRATVHGREIVLT